MNTDRLTFDDKGQYAFGGTVEFMQLPSGLVQVRIDDEVAWDSYNHPVSLNVDLNAEQVDELVKWLVSVRQNVRSATDETTDR